MRKIVSIFLVFVLALVFLAPNLHSPKKIQAQDDTGQLGPTFGRHGMVSTSNRYATLAGIEVLRQGGNAIDAAAAVQFVLNVAEPYASGIGGGLFMMVYLAETGEVIAIDGREEAPAGYTPDVFLNENGEPIPFFERATGGNSVGVPGTLAAVNRALEEYGTLELADVLQPAIQLARNGYTLDSVYAQTLVDNADRVKQFAGTAELYYDADGNPLPTGAVIVNEDLATTFEIIAAEGIGAFYGGEIGQDLVDAVQNSEVNPGVMTLEDLEGYLAVKREPVMTTYRGYEVYGMNMPTSGGTTLMLMLNLLEGFDMQAMEWGSADYLTTMANVQNIAFADRNAFMADADFVDVNVAGLLDKGYANQRRGLILNPMLAVPTPVAPGEPPIIEPEDEASFNINWGIPVNDTESVSTTHFSIVDQWGNMVAVTTTIELLMGSGVTVPGRGFLLNNELTDFSEFPVDANGNPIANATTGERAERRTALGDDATTVGGKRPRSSMAPTLVLRDGQPVMALGSPGGSAIIGYVFNVLVNILDYGMNIQEAVNAPRIVARNGRITLDNAWFIPENASILTARGFGVAGGNTGSVQVVLIGEDGTRYGAADPRRQGLALGH